MTPQIESICADTLPNKPVLSLAGVRWIREVEEKDEDGDTYISSVAMLDVVGEQYRLESVLAAKDAIIAEDGFLPPLFWLMPDDSNQHDANAVAVFSISGNRGYHVGFLPRTAAVHFRESMAGLGRPGQSLEVRGCITESKSNPHPNVRLNLPWPFAELVLAGFADDPANNPAWLADPTPVEKRPWSGPRAAAFTDGELCKIYCWHGRKSGWFILPDAVEENIGGYRASGLGSAGAALAPFIDDTPT